MASLPPSILSNQESSAKSIDWRLSVDHKDLGGPTVSSPKSPSQYNAQILRHSDALRHRASSTSDQDGILQDEDVHDQHAAGVMHHRLGPFGWHDPLVHAFVEIKNTQQQKYQLTAIFAPHRMS